MLVDQKISSKKPPVAVMLFSCITVVATILSLFTPKWEPLYIFVSSLQLLGIIGFSIYAFNKLVIKSNLDFIYRIGNFSPLLFMLATIAIQFGLLVSGPNKQQTGSKRLFNNVWGDANKYSWSGIQYRSFQFILLIQLWYLCQYIFKDINKRTNMSKFFICGIFSSTALGLLWQGLFPMYTQG